MSVVLQADAVPSWWTDRGVLSTNTVNDFAAVNQGQLKWMAVNAAVELETQLPGGAGSNVWALIETFSNTNNFRPVNLGQLKFVAQPFYDRLTNVGYTTSYPWAGSTNAANDYALANIGQMKNVFSFDVAGWLALDTDSDGMTNGWELAHGLNPRTNDASWVSPDPWAHGLSNWLVYQNPSVLISNNYSSLQDGVPDWWKLTYGYATNTQASTTGTNGLTLVQNYLYGRSPLVAELDVIVNGNSEWTTNRNVEVLPLIRSYPWLLVSDDATMTNATMLSIWTTNAWSCTIPGTNDCRTILYFQYLNASTNAVGPLLPRFIGVDTISPMVQVTAPTTNATGVGDQLFVHLQATVYDPQPQNPSMPDSSRPLKIWVNGERYWDRQGTLLDIPRFPVTPSTNTVIAIVAMDSAGNMTQTSLDWFVSPNTNAAPPAMTNINLEGVSLLPDLPEIWVQGKVDNSNAVVTATVNGGEPIPMNVCSNAFGYLVSLESGTNTVVLTAVDAASKTTSNVYTLVRTNTYRAAVTEPAFGAFVSETNLIVRGYVSDKLDEGTEAETTISNLTVNGVSATFGDLDQNGNRSFECQLNPQITAEEQARVLAVRMQWNDNRESTAPLALVEGYFVRAKKEKLVSNSGVLGKEAGVMWSVASYLTRQESAYEFKNPCAVPTNNATYGYLYYSDQVHVDDWFDEATFLYSKWIDWLAGTVGDAFTWEACELQPGLSLSFNEQESKMTVVQWVSGSETNFVAPYSTLNRPQEAEGSITCRAPMHYAPDTIVLLTFSNVEASVSLLNLTYRGQTAIVETNATGGTNVSFMVPMPGGSEFTINKDSFGWPDAFQPTVTTTNWTDYSEDDEGYSCLTVASGSTSARWLRFSGFHNQGPLLDVRITNGEAKPWFDYVNNWSWFGISMFSTMAYANKQAFVVISVHREWVPNGQPRKTTPDIYYLRMFGADAKGNMTEKVWFYKDDTNVWRYKSGPNGLYLALVDSCFVPGTLEHQVGNDSGTLEVTFTYTVYEGWPSANVMNQFNSLVGSWPNDNEEISLREEIRVRWRALGAYANEASHGKWSSSAPRIDAGVTKKLEGPITRKIVLEWDGLTTTNTPGRIITNEGKGPNGEALPPLRNGPDRWKNVENQ